MDMARVQGHAVHALQADLMQPKALENELIRVKPDYVVHLAAISFVGHADADAFYRVNVMGTLHLLDTLEALDTKPRRVLIASSANVYGNCTNSPRTERTAPCAGESLRSQQVGHGTHGQNPVAQIADLLHPPIQLHGNRPVTKFPDPKAGAAFSQKARQRLNLATWTWNESSMMYASCAILTCGCWGMLSQGKPTTCAQAALMRYGK